MDINTLEVIRNIFINYTVSNGTVKAATNVGVALLIFITSASISAGVYLDIYNTPKEKRKPLFIEAINKFKSRVKKKERI
jgi:hypothetical protein